MTVTISDLVGRVLDPVSLGNPKLYADSQVPVSNPDLYMGLELEIEGWTMGFRFPGMSVHNDGSLRNNGVEWKTLPTKLRHLNNLLTSFFKGFGVTEANYSDRCSTHVHVNVLDHTQEQLATVLLLYQVFERLLLNFVAPERRENIFCVPWYQAGVSYNLISKITKWDRFSVGEWHKYTALNIRTLNTFGTIEYRHLEGTCSVEKILTWCNLLGCIHSYAMQHSMKDVQDTITNLNTSSAYGALLNSVFKDWANSIMVEGYQLALEEGVLDCKYMLQTKTPKQKEKLLEETAPAAAAGQWEPGLDNPLRRQVNAPEILRGANRMTAAGIANALRAGRVEMAARQAHQEVAADLGGGQAMVDFFTNLPTERPNF